MYKLIWPLPNKYLKLKIATVHLRLQLVLMSLLSGNIKKLVQLRIKKTRGNELMIVSGLAVALAAWKHGQVSISLVLFYSLYD